MSFSGSCSICYELFAEAPDAVVPRKLKCLCVFCTNCIEVDLVDGIFFCPDCCTETKIVSVNDLPIACTDISGESDVSDEISSTGRSESPLTDIETEDNSTHSSIGHVVLTRSNSEPSVALPVPPHLSKRSSSSLRLSKNRLEDNAKLNSREKCKEPDCNFKVLNSSGYCYKHYNNSNLLLQGTVDTFSGLEMSSINLVSGEGKRLSVKSNRREWPEVNPNELIERFKKQKRMSLGEVFDLIDRAKNVFRIENNILRLDPPIITVGDIHGQFYDLLNIFKEGGSPGSEQSYLFLGDYVDRGSFSCEVLLTLLALKVTYPDRIYLIRGNHECSSVSGHFGFKEECKIKYGLNVYYQFLLLFQCLPLAAVISTAYGDIFACHGGISPQLQYLEDIDKLERFVEPESDQQTGLMDLLWSDPLADETSSKSEDDLNLLLNISWEKNPTRGCSVCFGFKAIRDFLDKVLVLQNSLLCLVRAHEVQEEGYRDHFSRQQQQYNIMHGNTEEVLNEFDLNINKERVTNNNDSNGNSNGSSSVNGNGDGNGESKNNSGIEANKSFPPVITIFSAPNYCDRYENRGAILKIGLAEKEFRRIQYSCVEHPVPEITENQANEHLSAVIASCPYMPIRFRDFIRTALELGPADSLWESSNGSFDDKEEEEEELEDIDSVRIDKDDAAILMEHSNVLDHQQQQQQQIQQQDHHRPSSSSSSSHCPGSNLRGSDSSSFIRKGVTTATATATLAADMSPSLMNRVPFLGPLLTDVSSTSDSGFSSPSSASSPSSPCDNTSHTSTSTSTLTSPTEIKQNCAEYATGNLKITNNNNNNNTTTSNNNYTSNNMNHMQLSSYDSPVLPVTVSVRKSKKKTDERHSRRVEVEVEDTVNIVHRPERNPATTPRAQSTTSATIASAGTTTPVPFQRARSLSSRDLNYKKSDLDSLDSLDVSSADNPKKLGSLDIEDDFVTKSRGGSWRHQSLTRTGSHRQLSSQSDKYSAATTNNNDSSYALNAALFQIADGERAAISVAYLKSKFEHLNSPSSHTNGNGNGGGGGVGGGGRCHSASSIHKLSSPAVRSEEILALKNNQNAPKVKDLKMKFMGKTDNPPYPLRSAFSVRGHPSKYHVVNSSNITNTFTSTYDDESSVLRRYSSADAVMRSYDTDRNYELDSIRYRRDRHSDKIIMKSPKSSLKITNIHHNNIKDNNNNNNDNIDIDNENEIEVGHISDDCDDDEVEVGVIEREVVFCEEKNHSHEDNSHQHELEHKHELQHEHEHENHSIIHRSNSFTKALN
eukprot:gene7631-15618_t